MNSTFGNRDSVDQQTSVLHIATDDAEPRGIRSGDLVRAFNDRGSLILTAEVDGVVGRGVVRAMPPRRALGQTVTGRPQRERSHIGAADRHRRWSDILQLSEVEVEKCGD